MRAVKQNSLVVEEKVRNMVEISAHRDQALIRIVEACRDRISIFEFPGLA